MRAGLIAAGALALAFFMAETAHAQAPVPCSFANGNHYDCNWWPPGNGTSGGALVVVGTTTVGYLHQGSNWIICQQKGGDVYNSRGYKNYWYGYTQADNNKWGWASAIEASGGDDYGPFGGGVPNCNGQYGSPPSYNGEWGHPPAPGTPPPAPVDADRDGYPSTVDCDDTNSRVYPGAVEVPNDGHRPGLQRQRRGREAERDRLQLVLGARELDTRVAAARERRARGRERRRDVRPEGQALPEGARLHDRRAGQGDDDQDVQAPAALRRTDRSHDHGAEHGRQGRALPPAARPLPEDLDAVPAAGGDEAGRLLI
jgi:hypothetical protein